MRSWIKKNIVRILSLCLSLIFVLSVFLIPVSAYEAPIINPCDDSNVVDDLVNMGYNVYDYTLDPSADFLQVIHFLEYAYSKTDLRYYSLYLYLYNPSGKKIADTGSTIQLCYSTKDGESKYLKYPLNVISASSDSEKSTKNVLVKLEVEGIRDIGVNIVSSNRVYNLASVEILFEGETKPVTKTLKSTDEKNRCKWIYTGFQKGFGSSAKDGTLRYNVDMLETIFIELYDASWMSDTSNLGEDYRWEVKSYFFNIPNSYIKKYGDVNSDTSGLIAVEGEYYKYGLNGLVVPDQTAYDVFESSVNPKKFKEDVVYDWGSFFKKLGQESTGNNVTHTQIYNDFSFNVLLDVDLDSGPDSLTYHSNKELKKYNLLSIGDSAYIDRFNFELLWHSFGNPVIADAEQMYIGKYLTNIGDRVDFKVNVSDDDLAGAIKTYASRDEWGSFNWLHQLFNKELYTDEDGYSNCAPLVEIEESDVSDIFKESVQGKNLFLDYSSYQKLQDFYSEMSNDNHIYLMRLGVDPFYEADVSLLDGPICEEVSSESLGIGHYYEKTIHKDMDIFAFTFKDEHGDVQRVPVECDPVDNLGSVVEGNNKDDMNPNKYPEDLTPFEIIEEGIKDVTDFVSSLKGMVILIISTIGLVAILILIIVFWKYLEPLFVRAGRGLGVVFRGVGKLFGGLLRIILNGFIALWNIGIFIGSIFFAPLSVLRINFIGSSGKSSSSDDSKYFYEDRKYKESEERRKQERHDAEMKLLERKNSPSVKNEKTYDSDEFFNAAVERANRDLTNENKKE